jgi:hypothetical protein
MEEIKAPKKERKFLKGLGEIALVLIRELVLGIGKKVINKVGNKRQGFVIAIVVLASSFAFAQYPSTGNKQRLGYQSTGDGLVFRGRSADTVSLKPSTINNAYHLFDTVNNVLFSYIKTKGGWKFNNSDTVIINGVTMPFDSITFNTAKDGTVGVGEVEYNDTQGSLIQGLKGGNVTNIIGQQLHQRVNNRTGATLTKGTAVYLSGSQGNRITVAKALGVTNAFSANTFGIVAESISNNQSGYVITEGLLTGINTSALVEDSAVYLSPTVAGGLTSTKPQAPQHTVYIGVCVKSNPGSGELFVKIRNGQELNELHDVRITSPVNNASLYYKSSEGIWRDTTPTLLVSDTASMLTNYLRSGVASNTYLPLAGGTLTGALNGTTATFNTRLGVGTFTGSPSLFTGGPGNQEVHFAHNQNIAGATVTLRLTNDNASFFNQGAYFQGIVNRGINEMSAALGTNGSEYIRLRGVDDGGIVGVGIFNDNPSYNLDLTGTFRATGNSLIGGTFGVTGATTLSNLAGSGTRMVTASSTGLLSTQTILTPTTRGSNTFTLPDIGAISFLRYNADNTVSQRGADGMRSDLGGTTVGQNMFTLTNPSAITFPRFNADNTVTALDAASFRTAIGAGTGSGSGTVTSVTAATPNPNGLSVTNSTTTPVISMALAASGTTGVVSNTTQSFSGAKTFLSDINGSSALNITGFSTLTGGASVGTLATTSTLTRVLGINASNAIGELSLGTGMSVGSGVLSVQAAGASQTGLVTSLTQTFGGNKTFNGTVTLASATGTATSVIGRSSTGQVVDLTLGSGLSLTSGTLTATAGNDVNIYLAINGPGITLSSSFGVYSHWYVNINQSSTVTITLPSASDNINKTLVIKNSGTGAVNSNTTNVEPLNSTTLGTAIMTSGGGKYATLVSNGSNWIKMAGN